MSDKATTAQRELIERLIRDAGMFDTRTITTMHRLLDVPRAFEGRPVAEWLGSLSKAQASALIAKLKEVA